MDPKSFNVPRLACLKPDQIDHVARALLTLTREVCVLTDRLMVLETILDANGIAVTQAVEQFQPDAAFEARADAAMGRIIDNVLASLEGKDC